MFTVQGKRESLRIGSFTLLEIMLAVGILGLMSLAIFRFVQANMTALRVSWIQLPWIPSMTGCATF